MNNKILILLFCCATAIASGQTYEDVGVYQKSFVLQEDFRDNRNEWVLGTFGEGCREFQLENGYYSIISHCKGSNPLVWKNEISGFSPDADFEIETRMRFVSGEDNNGNCLVWGMKDGNNRFRFCFSGNQYYIIDNFQGSWSTMKEWTKSEDVRPTDYNKLTVRKQANVYHFFLNENLVHSEPFSEFYGTQLGFQANQNTRVEVDYLRVAQIKPGNARTGDPLEVAPAVSTLPTTSGKRVALVIGVKSYEFVAPLANTLNDARDMSGLLKTKGFEVVEVYDPKSKTEIRNAVINFTKALRSDPNGVGLLYYSGHGMQVDGVNYLIPTGANLEIKADVEDQCMNMDYVMRAMEENGNSLNIVILDACRNNPFRSFSRAAEPGLSMVSAPKGTYIVFATKPGSVASDGTGRNGLFTSKLLRHMATPGLTLEQVFKNVAADVARDSNDAQRPWIASDYFGNFFFSRN